MTSLKSLLVAALVIFSYSVDAQSINSLLSKVIQAKSNSFINKYKLDGFRVAHTADVQMQNRTEFPIMMQLKEGEWYHFIVIGDPDAQRIEMKLGLKGLGDIITDRFSGPRTNEYWTQFSFICPISGNYLMTIYQKGDKQKYVGHIDVLQREGRALQHTTDAR